MPFGTLSGWVEDGKDAVSDTTSTVTDPISTTWDGFRTTTSDRFADLYGGAGSVAGGFGDTVTGAYDGFTSGVGDTVTSGTDAVTGGASGLYDGFTSGVGTVVDGAKETAGAPGRAADRMTMLVILGIAAVVLVAVME